LKHTGACFNYVGFHQFNFREAIIFFQRGQIIYFFGFKKEYESKKAEDSEARRSLLNSTCLRVPLSSFSDYPPLSLVDTIMGIDPRMF
jgi:hypothetical protein